MNGVLTLGGALLLGLVASGHCVVMCGGITAALGVATAKDARGRMRPMLLVGYQVGRITSYALAGLLFAGALGALISLLDIESVRRSMRALAALALVLGALVAFGSLRDPGTGVGHALWRRLAPLGRRLVPVTTFPRAFAFGMVWGWMPCGFVYTVLLFATLQADPIHAASIMLAFGVGTVPTMLMAALGAGRIVGLAARPAARQIAGSVLLVSALLTLVSPWMAHALPGLHASLPFH